MLQHSQDDLYMRTVQFILFPRNQTTEQSKKTKRKKEKEKKKKADQHYNMPS
jgi:hypothetical protein